MLNCEYCDYLINEADNRISACRCGFSGYLFLAEDFSKDMEYPCKDISYDNCPGREITLKA